MKAPANYEIQEERKLTIIKLYRALKTTLQNNEESKEQAAWSYDK